MCCAAQSTHQEKILNPPSPLSCPSPWRLRGSIIQGRRRRRRLLLLLRGGEQGGGGGALLEQVLLLPLLLRDGEGHVRVQLCVRLLDGLSGRGGYCIALLVCLCMNS